MAREKKQAGVPPPAERQDFGALLAATTPSEFHAGLVELATGLRAMAWSCPIEREWKLSHTARALRALAAELDAEWLRRRGGQP